jgi:DNA-binding transcriptional LysR family regulator
MELRALRYFLAVAEELHFGRAANRVGVTQPSLSQQIARLEAELDAALFTRSSRQVRLTPAGAAFLPGARRALIDAERAAHAARGAAEGLSGELIIGAIGSALNGVLPPLIRAFAAQSPGITLDVRQLDTAEQLAALQDNRLDIGFIRAAQPLPGIILATLAHEPLVAVLPAHHPLSALEHVPLTALAKEPFILWHRQASVGFHDEFVAACNARGFNPQAQYEARGAETLLGLVAAGLGVSVQPKPYENLRRTGVAFRPLTAPAITSQLQLATRRGDTSPPLQRFLTLAAPDTTGETTPT